MTEVKKLVVYVPLALAILSIAWLTVCLAQKSRYHYFERWNGTAYVLRVDNVTGKMELWTGQKGTEWTALGDDYAGKPEGVPAGAVGAIYESLAAPTPTRPPLTLQQLGGEDVSR